MEKFFKDNQNYGTMKIKDLFAETGVDLDKCPTLRGARLHEFLQKLGCDPKKQPKQNGELYTVYSGVDLNRLNAAQAILLHLESVEKAQRKTQPLPMPTVVAPLVKYEGVSLSTVVEAVLESLESLYELTTKNEFNRYVVIPNIKNHNVRRYLEEDERSCNFGNVMNDLAKKGVVVKVGSVNEKGKSVGVWSLVKYQTKQVEKQVQVPTVTSSDFVLRDFVAEISNKIASSITTDDLSTVVEKVKVLKELSNLV